MRWANRGYVCVFLQHPGSDVSIWEGKDPEEILPALKKALNLQNFLLRVKDVPAVLDQLTHGTSRAASALRSAGHGPRRHVGRSFGAITTEAVSGQTLPDGRALFADRRIKAAIIFSPSSPSAGTPKDAFAR